MDKLQWFKFTPTDWIMGKIQRCPEITQARFLRLVCLYWNKECLLSFEDAEIEIDKEHLDILINKKIIKLSENNIVIDFLDEQLQEINAVSEKRREAVLKRWSNKKNDEILVLQDSTNKKQNDTIVLKESTDVIQVDTNVLKESTDVIQVDTNVLQSDTEKRREEKRRKDKEKNREDNIYKFNFSKSLISYGADAKLVSEWIEVRKHKKCVNTETALKNFLKEVELSKKTIDEILNICIIKSWGGFEAKWIEKEKPQEAPKSNFIKGII